MKPQRILQAAALFAFMTAIMATISCGAQKSHAGETTATPVVVGYDKASAPNASFLPKAIVYKTNGDYVDNVPVTLDASRTALVSFPAPSDIAPSSTPIRLVDGYLLDRRGVGYDTAFTRWTYAEYAALPETPSPEAILAAVIPEGRVVKVVRLPMTLSEAEADTAAVNAFIRSL